MTYILVDVEADGACAGIFSMISVGAVVIPHHRDLSNTFKFYGTLKPITENWSDDALSSIGVTREQTLAYNDPFETTFLFYEFVRNFERPVFVSDNNGFDWQFVNYYFWSYCRDNPFGHSSVNMGSLYKGIERNIFKSFKHLRKTSHSHNPLDDAMGNAEAFIEMEKEGLILG